MPFALTCGRAAAGPPCPGPAPAPGPAAAAGSGIMERPLAVKRYAVVAPESTAMVRGLVFARCVPTCAPSGPSSAAAVPRTFPDESTSSMVGVAVTAAAALVRTGCTNLANMLPLTGYTAETGFAVA